MGVAGSGKTTVGRRLAEVLGWRFVDADDVHPAANVAKMARGEPLTDRDREPWLARLRDVVAEAREHAEPLVLACSALKARHRRRLGLPPGQSFLVYLRGSPELVAERLRRRSGHFAGSELLASQFEALEEPRNALVLDIEEPVETLVERIARELGGGDPADPSPKVSAPGAGSPSKTTRE